jgi:hypothetical protein
VTDSSAGEVRTIGIVGAGKSGIAIARQALAAGYLVRIATSGPAQRTALVTAILTPGAVATDTEHLADDVDLVVLAVPLRHFLELPLESLAGRIVVDMMNYWPPVDGTIPEFEDASRPSSAVVQDALPRTARLVKTFNHIGYHEIEELARPHGSPGRVGLGVAGDDADAVATVARVVDALGFDPVIAGPLAGSAALQPGSAAFGADLNRHALRTLLAQSAVSSAAFAA